MLLSKMNEPQKGEVACSAFYQKKSTTKNTVPVTFQILLMLFLFFFKFIFKDDDLDSTQMAPVGSGSDTERQKDTPSKITMNNILEKQYKILTLEETKLKLEIQKLELEKTKLKLELQKLGHEL